MSNWITGNETIPPMYLFDTPDAIERCYVEDFDNGVLDLALMREGFPTERYRLEMPKLVFNGVANPDSAKEVVDKMWGQLLPHQRFMLIKSLVTLIIEPAEKPAVEDLIDVVQDQTVNGTVPDFEDELEQAYWDFDTERKEGSTSERDIFKSKVRYLVSKAI